MPQSAQALGDDNIIVQMSGDHNTVNVHGSAYLTLTSRIRSPKAVNELDILIPESCAIPLIGREDDRATLRRWLSSARIVSVLSLIGQGGSGKTRLALEMIREYTNDPSASWDAGFVTHAEFRRFISKQNLSTWGWQKDTFVVLDYAAALGGDLRTCLGEIAESISGQRHKLRILLLERHADPNYGWYAGLIPSSWQQNAVRSLFDPWEPLHIQPIAELPGRYEILRAAMEWGATLRRSQFPALPQVGTDPTFDFRLSDPKWGDPLMLMMAAFTALDTGVAGALALSRREVAARLASREADRLRRFAHNDGYAADFLVHLAACVTLCGGLSLAHTISFAEQESSVLGLQYPQGFRAAALDLQRALPTSQGVAAIRPDLVGEAFLLVAWDKENPNETITRALDIAERNVLKTLIHAAEDFVDHRESRPLTWLDPIVAGTTEYRRLDMLSKAMPDKTMCLRNTAYRIDARLLQFGQELPDVERALLLVNLSNRQNALSEWEAALESIQAATNIYRDLSTARPEDFLPGLAATLNNLYNCQIALGLHEQAFESIRECCEIFENLVSSRRDIGLYSAAAWSFVNRSSAESDRGLHESALLTIEGAVNIYRHLETFRPGLFSQKLATALRNSSMRHSDIGQHEQALATIQESVELFRDLAAHRPDSFLLELAGSVGVLCDCHASLGHLEASLSAAAESLQLLLPAFRVQPRVFFGFVQFCAGVYLSRCEALDRQPDHDLIKPILAYEVESLEKKT